MTAAAGEAIHSKHTAPLHLSSGEDTYLKSVRRTAVAAVGK